MNEFKSVPGLSSSAPLNMNGDIHRKRPDDSEPRVSLGTCYVSCFIFDIQNVINSPHPHRRTSMVVRHSSKKCVNAASLTIKNLNFMTS